jgi:roadblock/LC7 domain-containing protein
MKRLLLYTFLCLAATAFGQGKSYEKAKTTYAQGNLKGANSLIDKCLEDPATKNNPNVLLLKSKIMFSIFMDRTLLEKFPSALKDAMKYAEKSLDANPAESSKNAFRDANSEYFTKLLRENNKEALEAYNTKKYSKALPLFKRSMNFGLDTQSLVLTADCYWNMGKETESVSYFKKGAEIIYKAVLDSNSKVYGYFKEPFRKLGKYYIDRQQYDSAYVIVKNGREILPSDAVLTDYTYKLMRYTLDKIPPSIDYMNMVTQGLKDFPSDSFLNHRENSIYIFLLNGMAVANEQTQFDSLLSQYAATKAGKSKLRNYHLIRRYDIFAGQDKKTFLQSLKYYFADFNLPEATYATFRYQIARPGISEQAALDSAKKEKNTKAADYIFDRHISLNPKSALFIKGRADYTSGRNKGSVGYYDLLPLIHLNEAGARDFPKDLSFKAKIKEYRLRLINETIDSADFRLARRTWTESAKLYPDQSKTLDAQWRRIVENDFKVNYYGSRINARGKNEKGIPEYSWNGNIDSCLAGKMPENIVLRVEQRINYFRRMAGVTEDVLLSTQDNEYCQYAAMMCEANKTMSHEPNDGWRCFIPAGADALKNSILSKDGNPGIAVTAAMGQNHASAGNRRWLLFPKAQYMGIGTTKSFSVIKAVDNSRAIDSNKYKTSFVAWPPASYTPKMLVFKKWSFSLDQNLQGAVVTMKDASGQTVNVKQDAYVKGYGMNTLVWEPEINMAALTADASYTVTVKLASGKVYTYVVKIIDVKI